MSSSPPKRARRHAADTLAWHLWGYRVPIAEATDVRLRPWQLRPYISSGYRFAQTTSGAFLSAFALHNESGNVWSHFVGAAWTLYVGFSVERPPTASWSAEVAYWFGLLCIAGCFTASTIFHALTAHADRDVCMFGAKLDYAGIYLFISGLMTSASFFGFVCFTWARYFWVTSLFCLTVTGMALLVSSYFHRPEYTSYRLVFFAFTAAFSLVPLLHWASVSTAPVELRLHIVLNTIKVARARRRRKNAVR